MQQGHDGTGHGVRPEPRVGIRRERRYRPLEAGEFHILTTVSAPTIARPDRQRPPLDLAFVVDRSGSMANGALELAKQGVEHALGLLDERDSISLVVYDDRIDLLLSQRRYDPEAHDKAKRRLRRIEARGSTALADGWLSGCQQLAPIADGTRQIRSDAGRPVCRALLLTDGLANVGITDPAELARHAAELRRRGISTSTFGVGYGYDEVLLGAMADAGGGHFHHIPRAEAIAAAFAGELGELLALALRDLTLSLRVPSGWRARLVNELPVERDADGWLTLSLGDLFSGEDRRLLWVVDLPAAAHGTSEAFELRMRWKDADGIHEYHQAIRHTVEASYQPGERDRPVEEMMGRVYAAQARAQAVEHNRRGNYRAARQALTMPGAVAQSVFARTRYDEEIADADVLARPASPADMKRQFTKARNLRRSRRDYSGGEQ